MVRPSTTADHGDHHHQITQNHRVNNLISNYENGKIQAIRNAQETLQVNSVHKQSSSSGFNTTPLNLDHQSSITSNSKSTSNGFNTLPQVTSGPTLTTSSKTRSSNHPNPNQDQISLATSNSNFSASQNDEVSSDSRKVQYTNHTQSITGTNSSVAGINTTAPSIGSLSNLPRVSIRDPSEQQLHMHEQLNLTGSTISTIGGLNLNPAAAGGNLNTSHNSSQHRDHNQNSQSSNNTGSTASHINPDPLTKLAARYNGSKRNGLLKWCQERTQDYKHVEITNFSSSWSDGLALCALLHTYIPNRVPWKKLSPANRRQNLQTALNAANSYNIYLEMKVDEMLDSDRPEWEKVMKDVASIYKFFET